MRLTTHIFDVGHGDCIVGLFEEHGSTIATFVIDCKLYKRGAKKTAAINPAYVFLKKLGITRIDLLVITHLHFDHFSGVDQILDDNSISIGTLVVPPFLSSKDEIFDKIFEQVSKKIKEANARGGSDPLIKGQLRSLATLLVYISNNEDKVLEGQGPTQVISLPGGIEVRVLLPLKKIKGLIHQRLTTGTFELEDFPEMNDSSIALLVAPDAHTKFLFSGDSTIDQWNEHQRHMERGNISNLDVVFHKVSHHGSKHNNASDLYKYLLASGTVAKHVFVSANGRTHPHDEFFNLVTSFQLEPFCTNLASSCTSNNLHSIGPTVGLPAAFQPFLSNYTGDGAIPCQGDITVVLEPGLPPQVFNSTARPCVYQSQPRPTRVVI